MCVQPVMLVNVFNLIMTSWFLRDTEWLTDWLAGYLVPGTTSDHKLHLRAATRQEK